MVSISFDWTVLLQIANFLVLMLVLNFVVYKPLLRIMKEREELFEALRTSAVVSKQILDDGAAQQERHRLALLQEGAAAQSRLKEEGRARESALLNEAQSEAAQRLERARADLARDLETARSALQAEAAGLAAEAAGKLLGRNLELS
jgi:F-type H+-transporting ATPase subunit b